jgi:hypothetical protein
VRYVTVGSFVHRDRAGANRFHFTARVNGRALARGRYRLTATPVLSGLKGASRSIAFRVI